MLIGDSPAPDEGSGPDPFHLSDERAQLDKGGRTAFMALRDLSPEVRAVVQYAAGAVKEENLRLLRTLVESAEGDPPIIQVQDWSRPGAEFSYAASRFSQLTQQHLLANIEQGKGTYMVTQLGRYVAAWSELTEKQIEKLEVSGLGDLFRP